MTVKTSFVIVLIALNAISSLRSQDIDPQLIPGPPTTEGPATTSPVDSTEAVITGETSTLVDTQTEPNFTEEPTASTSTNVDQTADSTEMTPETTETDPSTTSEESTTSREESTTNIPTSVSTTVSPSEETTVSLTENKTPGTDVINEKTLICRVIEKPGRPYYNWLFRVVVIPKSCSFCCRLNCNGLEQCTEISPFFCSI